MNQNPLQYTGTMMHPTQSLTQNRYPMVAQMHMMHNQAIFQNPRDLLSQNFQQPPISPSYQMPSKKVPTQHINNSVQNNLPFYSRPRPPQEE